MINGDKMTITSTPGYKYNLSRTSYDVHQEINAKVIGVLKYNQAIRNKLLNLNIGKYYQSKIDENIIGNSSFNSFFVRKPLSFWEEGLLNITHIIDSDYQKFINQRYGLGDMVQYYENTVLPNKDMRNKYYLSEDYIQYLDKILNSQPMVSQIISNINNFLKYDNIKYAMESTRIGTVNPNPQASLLGAVTTNINSFSGTDTRLGLITNELYAHTLKNAALFNSLRKTNYITPSVYNLLGNKENNIATLGIDFRIDENIGRLAYDLYPNYEQNNIDIYQLLDSDDERSNYFQRLDLTTNRAQKNISLFEFTKNLFESAFIQQSNNDRITEDIQGLQHLGTYSDAPNEQNINAYSLVSKFYHNTGNNTTASLLQSAIHSQYGISHGRNLVRKNNQKSQNGNPYCRVWNVDEPYETVNNLMRYGHKVKPNSVLNPNSFVNITPKPTIDSQFDIKTCMFSIENLAWIDEAKNNLSKEQIGPNGGRIMWFPPYDLKFNENISVNWNPNEFIGRGEKIYTYTNTERSGTLSFILLVDHPSVLNTWKKGKNELGLDEKNKAKEDYLRFFAGCDIEINNTPVNNGVQNNQPEGNTVPYQGTTDKSEIIFYVFFPNYYSGYDDGSNDEKYDYLANHYEADDQNKGNYDNGEKYPWKYRVDNDIKNKPQEGRNLKKNNYKDTTCFGLNNSMENGASDATNTFQEFYNNKIDLSQQNIDNIRITPCASNHGSDSINNQLMQRRFDFIKTFLNSRYPNVTIVRGDNQKIPVPDTDISTRASKLARCVKVEIKLKDITTQSAVTVDNAVNETVSTTLMAQQEPTVINGSRQTTTSKNRHDEEAQYFELLQENDKFCYDEIVDKIQYFVPAFHSITPEGFNARLAFLHQCSRQGATCSVSDTNNRFKSAGNMAFGRPPICVLRIGDFYYTKIIIDNITINYEDSTWDMNPEGVGVQPLFARISLNFKFLGGNDIGAPIARLQNAISFNYYANQSLYDNRAKQGIYKNNKPTIK